jgi:hypothetical protein
LEKGLEFGKRIKWVNPFTVRPSPTSNRPEAHPEWPSFSSAPGRGCRAAHRFLTGRPRFRPADSPVCAAIAYPYPLHTSQQRRSHSYHASLHRRLCPTRAHPAATLCAAPPQLSPVSYLLELPSRLHAVRTLRRMKLHPRVEPLHHEEGPKPTDAIHFPRHGRPVIDSSLHPPFGPNSTSTSFTLAHCYSLARQMPPSAAPLAPHRRASFSRPPTTVEQPPR